MAIIAFQQLGMRFQAPYLYVLGKVSARNVICYIYYVLRILSNHIESFQCWVGAQKLAVHDLVNICVAKE